MRLASADSRLLLELAIAPGGVPAKTHPRNRLQPPLKVRWNVGRRGRKPFCL